MRRFAGNFREDYLKKDFREDKRKKAIQERGIVPGVKVRISGRETIWEVENISADFFVKFKGASRRIDPGECEVYKD